MASLLDTGMPVNIDPGVPINVHKPGVDDGKATTTDYAGNALPEPVRIIHKEQDSISAFCLNQVIFSYRVLSFSKCSSVNHGRLTFILLIALACLTLSKQGFTRS